MENYTQTSFIPKKPVNTRRLGRSGSIFSFLALFLIIITVGLSITLYIYQRNLTIKIKNLNQSLITSKDRFDEKTLSEIQLLDKRLKASKLVLSNHTVISPLFTLLNELTIPSVQFIKFSSKVDSTSGKDVIIKMSGFAKDYKSIAIQSQVFNSDKAKDLKDIVFSNLSILDEPEIKGYISFEVSFRMNQVLYESLILKENAVLNN